MRRVLVEGVDYTVETAPNIDAGGTLVQIVPLRPLLANNDPPAAELVACECIVLAETKDHFDWDLIGRCAKELPPEVARVRFMANAAAHVQPID